MLSKKIQEEIHNYLSVRFKLKDLLAVTLTDTNRALFANQKNCHRGFSANTLAQFFTHSMRVSGSTERQVTAVVGVHYELGKQGVSVRVLMELAVIRQWL